jgi:hypothetical protein
MGKTKSFIFLLLMLIILGPTYGWAAMLTFQGGTQEGPGGVRMAASTMTRPSDKEPVFEVVSPARASSIKAKPLAPSLKALEGKTICELWNYVFLGDVTFPKIKELLVKKYPGVKFVPYTEFERTHGPDEESERAMIKALPGKLKKYGCDAVLSGNGG